MAWAEHSKAAMVVALVAEWEAEEATEPIDLSSTNQKTWMNEKTFLLTPSLPPSLANLPNPP